MVPLSEEPKADLTDKDVLMISGQMDPIIPPENSARLAEQLTASGAKVHHSVLPTGHGLTQQDVALTQGWLAGKPLERESASSGPGPA
jgi:phospholipase/carboxylesterase